MPIIHIFDPLATYKPRPRRTYGVLLLQKGVDGLLILKKTRDDFIFSLNPTINQEGRPLAQRVAKD